MKKLYIIIIILISVNFIYCDVTKIISYKEALELSANEKILDVPVLNQIKEAPSTGYCGESSIQMILAYYGIDKSQIEINHAGNPSHPDLYSDEIIPAIENVTNNEFSGNIGYPIILKKTKWYNRVLQKILPSYRDLIKYQINNNNPILSGFKLNPSKFTDWGLDHFAVINGYDDNGLYILTTWDSMPKIYRTWEQLESLDLYSENYREGYSFCNLDKENCGIYSIVISKNETIK